MVQRMSGFAPCVVVMLIGAALMLAAGVAWASDAPAARGGQAVPPERLIGGFVGSPKAPVARVVDGRSWARPSNAR